MKKDCKAQKLESMKLTKKQLQTETYMYRNSGSSNGLTIEELTLDQCRMLLYKSMKEQQQIDKCITKAYIALQDALP